MRMTTKKKTGLVAAALILAAVMLVNETTPYPGLAAILPAAGAALLIVAGERGELPSTRLLGSSVPRWFGRISYSLYLWHWPIIVLGVIVLNTTDLLPRVALAVASIGVAAASTRFIEQPFRIAAGAPSTSYLSYVFTWGQTAGTATFDAPAVGSYVARAFPNNTYEVLAESGFTVANATVVPGQSSYAAGAPISSPPPWSTKAPGCAGPSWSPTPASCR